MLTAELIQKADHDPGAFQEVYAYYFPKVYAYVAYRVQRKQDIEDLVSEIFLTVVEQIAHFEYRGEHTFSAWIFKIAFNLVSGFRRQSKRHTSLLALDELPDLRSNGLSPDQVIVQKELFTHLYHLIDTLPPRQQEIVTLRFFADLRNREIARILDIDERTVAAHLSRALKILHNRYLNTLESEQTTYARQKSTP